MRADAQTKIVLNTTPFHIGCVGGGDHGARVRMDDLRMYSRTLSQAEIATIYGAGR